MPKQIPMMVTVAGVRRLTPRMARVTVAGDELRGFRYDGPDQLARLFLPNASGELTLPVTDSWWPEMCAMPEAVRPVLRNYTVRRLDPEAAELDLDFVLHGSGEHAGPGSSWAENAQVGDKIGVLSDGADYQPPPDTTWQLLIADESALPAVAAILDQAPTGQHIIALLEVTDETDELPLPTSPDITVRWIHRGTGPRNKPVLAALHELDLPEGTPYIWAAGESTLATTTRRHLVKQRGIPKDRIYFCGYWREAPS